MQSWPRTGSPRQEGMQAEMASDFAIIRLVLGRRECRQ